jgi:hypothetical protein
MDGTWRLTGTSQSRQVALASGTGKGNACEVMITGASLQSCGQGSLGVDTVVDFCLRSPDLPQDNVAIHL